MSLAPDPPDHPPEDPDPSPVVLSNGRYRVRIAGTGSGDSALGELAVTPPWRDPLEDSCGWALFLKDEVSGRGEGFHLREPSDALPGPVLRKFPGGVRISRTIAGLEATLEVQVPAGVDGELRTVILGNPGSRVRRIQLTAWVEVALNFPAAHAAHPGFSRLFLETEAAPGVGAVLVRRRSRAAGEAWPWAAHVLLDGALLDYDTDRARFLGRGEFARIPRALREGGPLSRTTGPVLDPILVLRTVASLEPGETRRVRFALVTGKHRGEVLSAIETLGPVSGPPPPEVPPPSPSRPAPASAPVQPPRPPLRFFNGLGGFSETGDEYRIHLAARESRLALPPLPWINVVANERFGFLVSETGAGYTWAGNSRERRLTPWYNDPVLDPHGEAWYVRDEETGAFWSALPGPRPRAASYEVAHGLGYSRFRFAGSDLDHEVTLFVPRADPIKVVRIRLTNRGARPRRLSVFAFARLVLGSEPDPTGGFVVTEWDGPGDILWARTLHPGLAGVEPAFSALAGAAVSTHHSGDRRAFLGAGGDPASPAALREAATLDGRTGSGLDPCFAQQAVIEIPPGESAVVSHLLGAASDLEASRSLVERYRAAGEVDRALAEIRQFWKTGVSGVRISTPSPALDLLVNHWLPYQVLSCRLWGRSAFYQSGGAFGYRDQLQDAAALLPLWPERTRDQVLLHAAHQFEEGDVLHWWHPPGGMGIRTRFSDDLLWLPFVTAAYVAWTGDGTILSETIPFLTARGLAPGEDEAHLRPERSSRSADLYEHCCLAIDRSLLRGERGLPLFGTGDWNDGMNRVGREGRGESVWVGFFLYAVLGEFLPFCEARGDAGRGRTYREHRESLRHALEETGWDGAWYRRGYYDDGTPLGSSGSEECRIDALVQAWAVLSGAASPERAARALDAVEEHLVSEADGLIRLLTPPFDRTARDPGYIRGYLPGVRENGGQYTHAVLWVVQALARLGRADRAARLLELLLPVHHARTPEEVAVYRVEPYVAAADVYGEPPHVGRGGWTWYTGSAGWMYRVALESILGFRIEGGRMLVLEPCIPGAWPGFTLEHRLPGEETVFEIHVTRPDAMASGGLEASLDGCPAPVERGAVRIPLVHDGLRHRVEVRLGAKQELVG